MIAENGLTVTVYAADEISAGRAAEAAGILGAPFTRAEPDDGTPVLRFAADGVTFVCGGMEIKGDFSRLARRVRGANLREELLVRAVRSKDIPRPRVLDATAGLGEDSFLLAAYGCEVTLYERDDVMFILLEDALMRALRDPGLCTIAARMKAVHGDSIPAMRNADGAYGAVLLDPMFPQREKSALVKKKLQLIQQLEPPCTDEAELLCAAVAARPRKVVIKRPAKGPFLAGRKPDHSISGKAVRYDCVNVRSD